MARHWDQTEVDHEMVIEFLCPNGHKIRCADNRGGKAAKCPKCGVRFYVPGPEESEPSESGSWATAPVQASDSPGSAAGAKGGMKNQVEFLCPNGHRLWAALSLQGRPGQCPDCGSKFHIPTLADFERHAAEMASPGDSVVDLEEFGLGLGGSSSGMRLGLPDLAGGLNKKAQAAPSAPDAVARLLTRLAADLPEGAAFELLTRDGRTFVPHRFALELCDARRLAFSVQADDQTHLLVVVPWESINRIEIRGLANLPREFRS